jgi:hypothetical protein
MTLFLEFCSTFQVFPGSATKAKRRHTGSVGNDEGVYLMRLLMMMMIDD